MENILYQWIKYQYIKIGDSKTWMSMIVSDGKKHVLVFMHVWVYVLYACTYICTQSCMHLCVHRRMQVCIHVCLDGIMCCYVALLYVIIDWIKPMRKTLSRLQFQTSQLCRKLQNMVVEYMHTYPQPYVHPWEDD